MEKNMETRGCIGVILGLYWDYIGMLEMKWKLLLRV